MVLASTSFVAATTTTVYDPPPLPQQAPGTRESDTTTTTSRGHTWRSALETGRKAGRSFLGYHPEKRHEKVRTVRTVEGDETDHTTVTLDTDQQPPIAPPDTPPQKSAKRSLSDAQPRDVSHSERQSPAKRYAGKGPRVYAHPLANPFQRPRRRRDPSPTPARLQTTSLVNDDCPEDDDADYSPLGDDHPFFLPNPTQSPPSHPFSTSAADLAPSPSESASSPPPASPSPAVQSAPPSPSLTAHGLPPSPTLTATPHTDDAQMEDIDTPPAFAAPTRATWLITEATHKADNPHRPRVIDNEQATTQHSDFQAFHPGWTDPILPDHVLLDNVDDPTQKAIRANPEKFLAITPFCSGAVLTEKYKNLRTDTLKVIELLVGKDKVTLIQPQIKSATKDIRRGSGKVNKFAPPIVLIARCSDTDARAKLIGQATFGRDHGLAFHVTPFSAECLSWAIGFFRTDITDTTEVAVRRLTYAVYYALQNPDEVKDASKILALLDRATQGTSSAPRDRRTLEWALTLDARFIPHPENPVFVLMAKPCTKNPQLWDELRAAVRKVTYSDDLEAFIPHANAMSGHNNCADCKLDCHPKYNCTFTVRDKAWWGPADLTHALRYIKGGDDASDDNSEGERRGAPRMRTGRGRGDYRAGGRGRGR
ncbi:hypothetical protein GGX14DRAFT_556942 [Mycena pura]|uniref:Uncharacterized protein n=1 Tax=Mycena pura TaxID=153505 RepID=A0AAD6YMK5_9AGAR|nr:hypothetical protein GGX14DRAFT_556942 [Mycena pura]